METWKRRQDPKYQQDVENFVRREVYHCVSSLVHELAQNEKYMEELMSVCSMPDPDNEDEYTEAYEHWIVSDWLAKKLEAKGEMVIYDFLGLTIWGRTTTGQSISIDGIICDIWDDLEISRIKTIRAMESLEEPKKSWPY